MFRFYEPSIGFFPGSAGQRLSLFAQHWFVVEVSSILL